MAVESWIFVCSFEPESKQYKQKSRFESETSHITATTVRWDAELLNPNTNFRCKLFHWVTNSTSDISTNRNPKALPNILQHTASFCSNYPSSTVSLPLQLTTVRATEQSVLKL